MGQQEQWGTKRMEFGSTEKATEPQKKNIRDNTGKSPKKSMRRQASD